MLRDAVAVSEFLSRVSRRVTWIAAARGAALGFVAALLLAVLPPADVSVPIARSVLSAIIVALGAAAAVLLDRRRRAHVATLVERRAPQCRNVVITAEELLARRGAAPDYVTTLVFRQAARAVAVLNVAELFPARASLAGLAAAASLWGAGEWRPASVRAPLAAAFRQSSAADIAGVRSVSVAVVPPTYTGRTTTVLHDPQRVEALAGSALRLSGRSDADRVAIEMLGRTDTVRVSGGEFTAELPADGDGYVAIQPLTSGAPPGPRRLIGLTVIPDAPPRVRITAPARDLLLPDAHTTIAIGVDAADDIGLSTLVLRYTKVSGSGERYTFANGEVPLNVTRATGRRWTASAQWPLDSLGLSPGDMVVYRAVATDARPGAAASESDSFIAEVAAPGGQAAPGFALDPNEERYAVSQQMVILKTERLLARKPQLSADAFTAEAQDLAGEQRKVRAEFVFMMGGEVADAPDPQGSMTDLNEETEAAGESDLAAGRMVNQGRAALLNAIRSMSRATTSLTASDVSGALPFERAALSQLERAFSRSRIILRALTERERLDPTRRLTGTLADVTRDARAGTDVASDPRLVALRRALSDIAAVDAGIGSAGDTPARATARATAIAQQVLGIDPSAKGLQQVAAALSSAAAALERGRSANARAQLDSAARGVAALLRAELPAASAATPSLGASRLSGAFVDALRGAGRP